MHQTFYIDIDEEITSVVERLRHARTSEIILVVPKRALLIQSIVNLRILKREADEARLQLMMVTQDKLGKILIEKAGIFVQQKMDNISDEEINADDEETPLLAPEYKMERVETNPGNRLNTIGSSNYFDAGLAMENIKAEQIKLKVEKPLVDKMRPEKEILINRELVIANEKTTEKKLIARPSFDLQLAAPVVKDLPSAPSTKNFPNREIEFDRNRSSDSGYNLNPQDKKIEDFFYHPGTATQKIKKDTNRENDLKTYNLPGKVHRWFWVFGLVALLIAAGIGSYIFVPKADIVISVKLDSASVDSQVTGKTSATAVDLENGIIPAVLVSSKQEVTESYTASGSGLVSNQKSHGTVTIYNAYSSSAQPLVATTRFLTTEGKLFRLVKGVTVPGTRLENGQVKNGEVTAEIAADESGGGGNIGPATFNIPGFKSSGVKYEKIYAVSTVAMTGGGNGSSESKVITDADIATAKNKILTALNDKLEEDMKKSDGEDMLILDGAMNGSDVVYKISNSAGDVADSFQITASTEAKALVVSQKNLTGAIAEILSKGIPGKSIDPASIKTDFSRSNVDFANGTLDIKFHAVGKINPDFTSAIVKKAILGKNEEQLKAYFSNLSNIEKVEINYWPPFVNGRIPLLPSRASVTLDQI